MLEYILIFVLFVLVVFLIFKCFSIIKEIELLTDYIQSLFDERENTKEILKEMLEEMKTIDSNGSFESDDEVGVVFNELKTLIENYEKTIL